MSIFYHIVVLNICFARGYVSLLTFARKERIMVRLQIVSRFAALHKFKQWSPTSVYLTRLYSSKSDSEGESDKVAKKKSKPSNDEAVNRLNMLLKQMLENDSTKVKPKLVLARPKSSRDIKPEPGTKSVKMEPVEKQIISAVKNVAEVIGGNKKQTESELLSKLLNSKNDTKLDDIPNNLSDIVKGMKIDRDSKPEIKSRARQVQDVLGMAKPFTRTDKSRRREPRPREAQSVEQAEPIDIFGSDPLGIFTFNINECKEVVNETWRKLYERELRLAVTHPPLNYFQEMILWTEQGKLWKFPIENEQGMEDENNIYFAEHVFLERHLDPWCPQQGPVRHFMELVCVGLSKNPYMSVTDKKGHIEWYKNYFMDKMQILKDVGAIPADHKDTKQIKGE